VVVSVAGVGVGLVVVVVVLATKIGVSAVVWQVRGTAVGGVGCVV
jgi:hypothetical protein